ncbi:MAG TPA: rhodanese-like domain-containing protein [Rhodothermales bacterium]|nr:rhodanese-like domain-containing protein [Rhodothermales bacterium]
MLLRQITDPTLAQHAYLVGCPKTKEAAVIDPMRDVDTYLDAAAREGLRIVAVAETHIHADFLSGARALADATGAHLYLSAGGGADWAYRWTEGREDVTLLEDGDTFKVGNLTIQAVRTPGHTPEHVAFLVTDGGISEPMGVLSGDFVFAGDLGRPDLLETAAGETGAREPAAQALYRSVDVLLGWPDYLQVWPGHGAGSACGKALGAVPQTTVGYERRFNPSVLAARGGEDAFVEAILDGQNEPPLYFARMKRLNRDGVPALMALPQPSRLEADALGQYAGVRDVVVLDTRTDRSAFMRRHLPGALHAPLDKTFNTVAGSLVPAPETPIVLLVPEEGLARAVRDLVRVGLDHVVAWAPPETFEAYAEAGGATHTIEEIGVHDLNARHAAGASVLDVRYGPEFEARHVPGAVHVPYTRLAERLGEVPDGPILVHCQSGVRSAAAAAFLAREGYDVTYVNGQFNTWKPVLDEAAASANP